MSLGEQLNDLDRKVLGAAPVDRSRPAAPYDESVGELAPLARTLNIRAGVYLLGVVCLGLHLIFGGRWKALLICLALVIVPALLVARLSTNAFPERFPEAPGDALAEGRVGGTSRLALAMVLTTVGLLDLLLLHGKGEEVLFVLTGLPAVILWAIAAEVGAREEDGAVLASRIRQKGRVGRGIYRVYRS